MIAASWSESAIEYSARTGSMIGLITTNVKDSVTEFLMSR